MTFRAGSARQITYCPVEKIATLRVTDGMKDVIGWKEHCQVIFYWSTRYVSGRSDLYIYSNLCHPKLGNVYITHHRYQLLQHHTWSLCCKWLWHFDNKFTSHNSFTGSVWKICMKMWMLVECYSYNACKSTNQIFVCWGFIHLFI